jgi:oxygen-dependent protoporphyrinogen oxidase
VTVPRIAIVGAGLAGLAAAARLRALGLEPRVLERDNDVGGVVRTWQRDGWIIDSGACAAAEPDPSVRALLDMAGVAECTVRAGPQVATRYIVHNGAPVPLPRTTAEFTSSPLLSLGGRLRLLKERFIPAQRDVVDESVDSFARRRFGDEVADRMFDPLVASTCAGDPTRILARFAFPTVVGHEHRAGSGLQGSLRARMEARRRAKGKPAGNWSCAAGMQQLPRRLASWIGGVQTGACVAAVAATRDGFNVVVGNGAPESFDAVIFAVPAPALGQIAFDAPESQRLAEVAAMPHASIVAVSFGFRREQVAHSLDGWRLLVPSLERRSLLSVVFPSSAFCDRAPEGHVLLTAFVGGARRPDLIDATDGDVLGLVTRELAELLGTSGDPVVTRITRWRDALPQAIAGHGRRLAAADVIESAAPGVVFSGAWRDGLSVAEVLLGGMHAADRLATRRGWMSASSPT